MLQVVASPGAEHRLPRVGWGTHDSFVVSALGWLTAAGCGQCNLSACGVLSQLGMRSLLLVDSQASLFGRVIGGAGFQLINVNNVSLRLGGWQTDTQLLSRKALGATLARHYRDEVIKEAHKVRPDISAECVRHQLRIHAMASGCCPSCEASTQLYTHCSAHAALNPLQPPLGVLQTPNPKP